MTERDKNLDISFPPFEDRAFQLLPERREKNKPAWGFSVQHDGERFIFTRKKGFEVITPSGRHLLHRTMTLEEMQRFISEGDIYLTSLSQLTIVKGPLPSNVQGFVDFVDGDRRRATILLDMAKRRLEKCKDNNNPSK